MEVGPLRGKAAWVSWDPAPSASHSVHELSLTLKGAYPSLYMYSILSLKLILNVL